MEGAAGVPVRKQPVDLVAPVGRQRCTDGTARRAAGQDHDSLEEVDGGLQELAVHDRCAGTERDLERALATLPPRARAVLVLHDIEGWKHQEIAEQLQMAVGSSKAQLHRARGLLSARLGDMT